MHRHSLPDTRLVAIMVIDVLRIPPGEILFAGGDLGLFRSADDGQHWTRYGPHPS